MVERSAGVGIPHPPGHDPGGGVLPTPINGQITIGSLAAFQALFLSLSYSLSYVTQFAPSLLLAAGGMRRIEDSALRGAGGSSTARAHRRSRRPPPRRSPSRTVAFSYVAADS
jgi:hypothetical protein